MTIFGQRTLLGDPAFVDGLDSYQSDMLSAEVAAEIRSKISDHHTLEVSSYNPNMLESLDT